MAGDSIKLRGKDFQLSGLCVRMPFSNINNIAQAAEKSGGKSSIFPCGFPSSLSALVATISML
jgi:hypothetical protein